MPSHLPLTTPLSTDEDLARVRASVLSYLPESQSGWDDQRERAEHQLLADLARCWYAPEAERRGVDPTKALLDPRRLDQAELIPLAVAKTLACIYEFLTKDGPEPDGFTRAREHYEAAYARGLEQLCAVGPGYDWDADGTLTRDETTPRPPRRLTRA